METDLFREEKKFCPEKSIYSIEKPFCIHVYLGNCDNIYNTTILPKKLGKMLNNHLFSHLLANFEKYQGWFFPHAGHFCAKKGFGRVSLYSSQKREDSSFPKG